MPTLIVSHCPTKNINRASKIITEMKDKTHLDNREETWI